ncbi:MAG: methyltransferase domain-containing protein [Enhygromyxa sp.]
MYHLPAYLALERWVLARTVVVVQPSGPEGPRRLLAAGARRVLVIGGDFASEPGMEVRPASGARLPLRDESVDLVICIEAFGGLRSTDRRELLRESYRVLRGEGIFCSWIEQREAEAFGRTLVGSSQVDFWGLEDQIGAIFPRVDMLAQMPWQGFSLAPILDDEAGGEEPQLALREELLDEAPEASHYLAVASKTRTPAGLARECLLVPLPRNEVFGFDPQAERDGVEIEELRDELDRLREELSLRAAKVAAAHGRVRELETQLESLRARSSEVEAAEVDRLRDALTEAETQLSIFRAREQEQGAQIARLEDDRAELLSALEAARDEQSSHGANVATTEAQLRRELEAARARVQEQEARLERELETAKTQSREDEAELRRELEAARVRSQEAEARLREADDRLRSHETDLQILTRTSGEHEKAVERLTAALDNERRALEQARADEKQLLARGSRPSTPSARSCAGKTRSTWPSARARASSPSGWRPSSRSPGAGPRSTSRPTRPRSKRPRASPASSRPCASASTRPKRPSPRPAREPRSSRPPPRKGPSRAGCWPTSPSIVIACARS